MSERKDWKRLNATRKCKDDSTNQFPTPKDVVEKMVDNYGHGLKGKKIHCFADDYRVSWFYRILKDRFTELGLKKLTATGYVENGKGVQAVYDGVNETAVELDDDGSMYGPSSMKATQDCDVMFTNPPFKKYSMMMKDVIGKKDFVLIAPHILPYRINDVENQIQYRIAKGEVFIELNEIAIWNEDHTRQAKCVIISTIEPKTQQKADITLSAKYDPAKHKMFLDADTGKPTGIINCDKVKDFPVDWSGLVAVPPTTIMKIANQNVHVNDVYGCCAIGGDKMELVDSISIHGFYGKGCFKNQCAELKTAQIIKVKLEDGRIPFQRLIVKLNRRAKA